jgi:hypothetical protein
VKQSRERRGLADEHQREIPRAAENATPRRMMVELCAKDRFAALDEAVHIGREKHTHDGSQEIHPEARP